MLTIVIKDYCVNVVGDIKYIHLKKHYYYLDKICFSFAKKKLSKLTLYKLN